MNIFPVDIEKRNNARARVLTYLKEHEGQWVQGWELADPEIGGSEGLRRLRELRQLLKEQGYTIEKRRPFHEQTAWDYRMVIDQEVVPQEQQQLLF